MSYTTLRLPDDIELSLILVPKRLFSYAASNAEFKQVTVKEAEARGIIKCKSRPEDGLGNWTLEVYQGVEMVFRCRPKGVPGRFTDAPAAAQATLIPQGVLPKSPPAVGSR